MLEATSIIDEARKKLEDSSKNDEDDDGGGLQTKSDHYEHILQLDPYPDPIDLEARVSADHRRVYDKITSHLLHLRNKSVHA